MWWIIVIVVVLIILAFLKYEHIRKTWHVLLLILLLLLIVVSMTTMIRTGQMDFSSPQSTINSMAIYFSWLGHTSIQIFNVGKESFVTVGNVIRGVNETQRREN